MGGVSGGKICFVFGSCFGLAGWAAEDEMQQPAGAHCALCFKLGIGFEACSLGDLCMGSRLFLAV